MVNRKSEVPRKQPPKECGKDGGISGRHSGKRHEKIDPDRILHRSGSFLTEVETGFEPVYTALQAVASPLGHSTRRLRADDGIRTRDPHLGKVMLYQLSHVRMRPTLD